MKYFKKEFWQYAGERAIKTFFQAAVAAVVGSQALSIVELNFAEVIGVAALAALVSIMTSMATGGVVDGEAEAEVEVDYGSDVDGQSDYDEDEADDEHDDDEKVIERFVKFIPREGKEKVKE